MLVGRYRVSTAGATSPDPERSIIFYFPSAPTENIGRLTIFTQDTASISRYECVITPCLTVDYPLTSALMPSSVRDKDSVLTPPFHLRRQCVSLNRVEQPTSRTMVSALNLNSTTESYLVGVFFEIW